MRNLRIGILFCLLTAGSVACHGDSDDTSSGDGDSGSGVRHARRLIEQMKPTVDLKTPPADATKTASGLHYKRLVANEAGAQPAASDTVVVRYTGWRPSTGETFFTTKASGQPIAIDIAHAAPGFREALPLLHKGEKVALWVPASSGTPEPVVYEVELVEIVSPAAAAPRSNVAKVSGGGAGAEMRRRE